MEENTQNSKQQATKQADEKLLDHDYDGIRELDNPPPKWIMAIFYITIGFSIIYGAYHFWLDTGDDQWEKYEKKSQLHDEKYQQGAAGEEGTMGMLTDEASLAAGKAIYAETACFACHGMNGEGNAVGPNLTDNAWIMGCDFQTVFDQVKNGNPAKGMTSYKGQLSDLKIQQVSSYILSLVGTDPANAKAPQGEVCE
ncbi:MAG: cbb3-type cytochrome c oxidase N-terminal domain-containing protein [Bacteroidota bacterium]